MSDFTLANDEIVSTSDLSSLSPSSSTVLSSSSLSSLMSSSTSITSRRTEEKKKEQKVFQLTEDELKKILSQATKQGQSSSITSLSSTSTTSLSSSSYSTSKKASSGFAIRQTGTRSGYKGSGKALRNIINVNDD